MQRRVEMGIVLFALAASAGLAAHVEASSPDPGATVSPWALSLAGGSDFESAARGTRLEAIRHRPRYGGGHRGRPRHARSGPRPESFSQLHLGFMDPDGPEGRGVLVGFRGGLSVDRHVQIGGQIDWRHRSNSQTELIQEGPGPGGTVITTRRDLARSSSDLVPLMGFVQLTGPSDLPVIPYFGLGGGYQILHLSAENFETGEEFEGTFGGFGWQLWGGAALPLSGRTRLTGEVFVNGAELSRDVDDFFTGESFRETVDMDATGMRFGVSWGF